MLSPSAFSSLSLSLSLFLSVPPLVTMFCVWHDVRTRAGKKSNSCPLSLWFLFLVIPFASERAREREEKDFPISPLPTLRPSPLSLSFPLSSLRFPREKATSVVERRDESSCLLLYFPMAAAAAAAAGGCCVDFEEPSSSSSSLIPRRVVSPQKGGDARAGRTGGRGLEFGSTVLSPTERSRPQRVRKGPSAGPATSEKKKENELS